MSYQRRFLMVILLSLLLMPATLVLLIVNLGWNVLLAVVGGIVIFAAVNALREAWQNLTRRL